MHRITLFDIPFDAIKRNDVVSYIDNFITDKKQHIIVTPNPEIVLSSLQNAEFKKILQQADLSLPDGVGILWASKFLSLPNASFIKICWQWLKTALSLIFYPSYCKTILPERIAGSDSMHNICSHASHKHYSLFLLGGKEGIAKKAKESLEKMYPSIQIAGTYSGKPFTEDDKTIIEKINLSCSQIVFVAFGSPKQELWITKNLSKMPSVKIWMGVGGTFDFIAGTIKRAPYVFQKLKLEWLWRLILEPKKRFPRIWNAVIRFSFLVLKQKLKKGKNK